MTTSGKTAHAVNTASATPRVKRVARRTVPAAPHTQTGQADAAQSADPGPSADKPKPPSGKLGIVVGLLRRPEGATVSQLSAATDWQPHSVRGAMAGALKKKHGLSIVSELAEGGRVYRLAAAAADAA